jgi:hypothetical protein
MQDILITVIMATASKYAYLFLADLNAISSIEN